MNFCFTVDDNIRAFAALADGNVDSLGRADLLSALSLD